MCIRDRSIFLCQPQGVVPFGPQAYLLEYLPINLDGTGNILLLGRILDKAVPIVNLYINGMNPAVIKKPGHIC